MNPVSRGFIAILQFYKKAVSPLLGQNCRFYPSCSQYAMDCFQHYPLAKALKKSVLRILKCHPFHEGGIDPAVPDPIKTVYLNQETKS